MEAWRGAEVDRFFRKGIFENSLEGCDDAEDGELAGDEYDDEGDVDENEDEESLSVALNLDS